MEPEDVESLIVHIACFGGLFLLCLAVLLAVVGWIMGWI